MHYVHNTAPLQASSMTPELPAGKTGKHMTTGEAAKRLSIDSKTVRNWLDEQTIAPLLSSGAKREHGGGHRSLNDDDLRILATIRHLRVVDKIMDWQEIRAHLETGKRIEPPTLDGIAAHTETVSRPFAEQGAQLAAIAAQRDALAEQVKELQSKLDSKDETLAALYREIGKLETLLEIERAKNKGDDE